MRGRRYDGQSRRELSDSRIHVKGPYGRPVASTLSDFRNHFSGQKRIAANLEEVIIGAHAFNFQCMQPYITDYGLGMPCFS